MRTLTRLAIAAALIAPFAGCENSIVPIGGDGGSSGQDAGGDDDEDVFIPGVPGDSANLDPLFGSGGLAFFEGERTVLGLDVQSDQKVVAAGSDGYFAGFVSRIMPDGSLDASFGTGGMVGVDVFRLLNVHVRDDGSIVATGSGFEGDQLTAVLLGFTSDGSPDPDFGTGGRVTLGLDEHLEFISSQSRNSALAADGSLVLVASEWAGGADPTSGTVSVRRFDRNGAVDPAFGEGGVTTVQAHVATQLVIDGAGRIVLAGFEDPDAFVMRLLPDGTPDAQFGQDGKVHFDTSTHWEFVKALGVSANDSVVAIGGRADSEETWLFRVLEDGAPDPTLGSADAPGRKRIDAAPGMRELFLGQIWSLAVEPDGGILFPMTGVSQTESDSGPRSAA